MVEQKMAGYPLGQIAADLGISYSTVHQKLKKLGLELAARAGVHIDFTEERRGRRRKSHDGLPGADEARVSV